jgi:DNA polymerase-3 subunit epsilon
MFFVINLDIMEKYSFIFIKGLQNMGHKVVFLDTETTGLDPRQGHRLTEIGCVELVNRQLTGATFQSYINPERELDARAAEITGLTWTFLKDKPLFKTMAEEFLAFIEGAELIIHNAPFDLGFLNHELTKIQYPHLPLQDHYTVIDTLVLAKKRHPGHRYYNLDALCQRYGVDNTHREKHGALLDAEILAEVYLKMTSGQVSLGFEPGEQEESRFPATVIQASVPSLNINSIQTTQSFTQNQRQLKIVYATQEEILTHEARLSKLLNKE